MTSIIFREINAYTQGLWVVFLMAAAVGSGMTLKETSSKGKFVGLVVFYSVLVYLSVVLRGLY